MAILRTMLSPLAPSFWYRKRPATDYDVVLARLSADIDAAQTHLARVRQRARRASVAWTLWAAVLWLAYAGACWAMHPVASDARTMAALVYAPITLVPVFLYFLRRIVSWWYRRIATAEELHLRTLQRERQAKIDEIKRATKYDSLRLLLEKYDDSPEARKGRMAAVGAQTPQTKAQLLQQQKAAAAAKSPNSKQGAEFQGKGAQAAAQQAQRGALAAGAPGASPVAAQLAAQAMPRTWLDRVADAVLGADGEANKVTPDEQKYALICRECRSHNGLCHKSEWDEVQYICPKCGAFNSRRPSSAPISSPWASTTQRRQGSAASTPASPLASSRIGAHAPQGEEMRELRGAQTAEEKQGQEAQRETDTEEDNAPPTMPLRAGASPAGSQEGSPKRKGLRARRSAAADSAEAMEMD